MPDLQPDATSRFRTAYRELSYEEQHLHDNIKAAAANLEEFFDLVEMVRSVENRKPQPRYAALAMTKLEEAVMWAVKGLTA